MKAFVARFLIAFMFVASTQLGLNSVLAADTTQQRPSKVLFVGNSITGLVPLMLQQLVESADKNAVFASDSSTSMGVVLEKLWASESRRQKITSERYDFVVLQATLSITGTVYGGLTADTETKFHEYAAKFNSLVQESGGKLVLFMHWQFDEAQSIPISEIVRIYGEVAKELHSRVAPIGIAFAEAQRQNNSLELLSDSVHSGTKGSYLAACVVYATLLGRSPEGLAHGPGLSDDTAAFLQKLSWEIVSKYQQPSTVN